jgi:hypothetical protein
MKAALIASFVAAASATPFNFCATDKLGIQEVSATPEPLVKNSNVQVVALARGAVARSADLFACFLKEN